MSFSNSLAFRLFVLQLLVQVLVCAGVYKGEKVGEGETMMSMVHFGSRYSDSYWVCGGVLITWKHVLTAAHCRVSAMSVQVFIGSRTLHEEEQGIVIPIAKVEYSPQYDKQWQYNDLAIVTLEKAYRSEMRSLGIRPIEIMWDASDLPLDTKLEVMGFGCKTVALDATVVRALRLGISYTATNEVCSSLFAMSDDPARSICLDGREGSACQGDSGGPVVYRRKGWEEPLLVGIVSGGEPTDGNCCIADEKWNAINVEGHKQWIMRATGRYNRWN